ncbi:MAG: hypothetical protein GF334_02750 [Candidatus Altiarchaeales archaeon]|nr:hypothetical protein [Candidatus Altiarchaeales archaeon]
MTKIAEDMIEFEYATSYAPELLVAFRTENLEGDTCNGYISLERAEELMVELSQAIGYAKMAEQSQED